MDLEAAPNMDESSEEEVENVDVEKEYEKEKQLIMALYETAQNNGNQAGVDHWREALNELEDAREGGTLQEYIENTLQHYKDRWEEMAQSEEGQRPDSN